MSKNLEETVESLKAEGVEFPTPVAEQRLGLLTHLKLPDGELQGLYEPKHPLGIQMRPVLRKTTRKPRAAKRKR